MGLIHHLHISIEHLQTSERLSSLYLIQRQIGVSHNAYFKFYLSKKDGCIGNSVVCKLHTVNLEIKSKITDSLLVCFMPRIHKSPGFHISPSHSEHILVGCDPQCRTPDERTHNNRGSGTHKTEQLTTQTPVSPVKRYLCALVTPSYHEEENIISIEYKKPMFLFKTLYCVNICVLFKCWFDKKLFIRKVLLIGAK